MANAIESFDLTVGAQIALDAMMPELTALSAFATRFTDQKLKKGKTLDVRLYNKPSGAGTGDFNKSSNNYATASDVDFDTVNITLDVHKKSTFALDDAEQAVEPNGGIPVQEIQNHAKVVAEEMLTNIWAEITNANFGAAGFTGAANTFDSDDLIDLRGAAVAANMDKRNLCAVLDDTYWTNLLKDADIKNVNLGGSSESLREGRIGRLAGFDLYESTLIPANGENLVGFITDKTGIAVCTAILDPGAGYENSMDFATAQDPATGFSLGMRRHYDPDTGTTYVTVEALAGKAVGRAGGLSRLVSA